MRHTNIILLVLVLISLTLTSKAFGKEVSETDKEKIIGRSAETRLHHMEKQLDRMYGPINQLNEPVSRLEKPVSGVGNQLDKLKKDLSELKQVVHVTSTLILCAIVGVGLFVAIGIPIGGIPILLKTHTRIHQWDQ